MTNHIPISAAKDIAAKHDLKQVIIVAWDGEKTHVVTYGKSVADCDLAARGGEFIKKALGWPQELWRTEPSRVKRLQQRVADLEAELAAAKCSEGKA